MSDAPFTIELTHSEMVLLMQTLEYRFKFVEATRRSTMQRDITNAYRDDGNALRERLSTVFSDERRAFEAAHMVDIPEEVDQ